MIDWSDGGCKISRYFTVRHALWLPSWKRLANEDDGLDRDAKDALIQFFSQMDQVREFLGVPIYIHCAYRPRGYNALVGGAKGSAHMARCIDLDKRTLVAAADFHCELLGYLPGEETCDRIRALLLPELGRFNLRMEYAPNTDWVHLDNKVVNGNRYFRP